MEALVNDIATTTLPVLLPFLFLFVQIDVQFEHEITSS